MTAVRRKTIPLALEPRHSERALAPKVLVLTRVILTENPCVCGTEKNDVKLPEGSVHSGGEKQRTGERCRLRL